jgi:hypothetical protein
MLPLLAFCAGIYLGFHFNILALLPFSLLGAGAYIASSLAAGHGFAATATALVIPLVTLQAGYMLGLTMRPVYEQLLARLNIGQSRRV